mgnify:CR=1 FL=1
MLLKSPNLNTDINSFSANKLPTRLQFEWNENWGNLIVLRLGNALEKGDTYEKFKISICPNEGVVLGMLKEELTEWDTNDDQWFGNQADLGELNKDVYSSPAKIFVYKDFETNDKLFSYYWHNKFDRLEEGQLPSNLNPDKLTKLLNGKLISELYTF